MKINIILFILLGSATPLFSETWSDPVARPKSTPISPKITADQEARAEQDLKHAEEMREVAAEQRLKQADEEREAAWRALKDIENNLPSPMAIMGGGMDQARGNHEEMVRIAKAKSDAATERWHQAKDLVEPYRIAREAEAKRIADEQQRAAETERKAGIEASIARERQAAAESSSSKHDENDGSPSDEEVRSIIKKIKPLTHLISNPSSFQEMEYNININYLIAGDVIKLERGKKLTSLVSQEIPTGTTVYPIRLTLDTTNQDLSAWTRGKPRVVVVYCYQDEFDGWKAEPKRGVER